MKWVTNWVTAKEGRINVQGIGSSRRLRSPIKKKGKEEEMSFDWHEVTKVAHYYLSVDAMTSPMQVREDSPPYGEHR